VYRVTTAAPRLDPRLVDRLERAARGAATVADIRRQLVVVARDLDVPPPSYEHVRRLVGLVRLERAWATEAAVLPVAVDVFLGREHGSELLRVAHGERRRRRPL
jgi:hypothetical protein